MKKLYLLGDSIRMGYEPMVRNKLSGLAEVYAPEVNGQFAQYTLRFLHEWAEKSGCANNIDLVHWNNGLWDCLRLFGDECLTPLDVYAGMLKRVYKRIKIIFPQAKVIFALSTPIREERFTNPEWFVRYNKDIKEYNNIATQIMKECGVAINDLYAIAETFTVDQYADMTHFSEEGYNILADAIVNVCEPYLKD